MTTAGLATLVGTQTPAPGVLGDGLLLLGDDFMPWIVLAFGAAMIVGNALALIRPPAPAAGEADPDAPEARPRPPLGRALVMIAIGAVAAIWGIASLIA